MFSRPGWTGGIIAMTNNSFKVPVPYQYGVKIQTYPLMVSIQRPEGLAICLWRLLTWCGPKKTNEEVAGLCKSLKLKDNSASLKGRSLLKEVTEVRRLSSAARDVSLCCGVEQLEVTGRLPVSDCTSLMWLRRQPASFPSTITDLINKFDVVLVYMPNGATGLCFEPSYKRRAFSFPAAGKRPPRLEKGK